MAICKICNLDNDIRKEIDSLSKEGKFSEASSYAIKNGVDVSKSYIKRHYNKHVAITYPVTKPDSHSISEPENESASGTESVIKTKPVTNSETITNSEPVITDTEPDSVIKTEPVTNSETIANIVDKPEKNLKLMASNFEMVQLILEMRKTAQKLLSEFNKDIRPFPKNELHTLSIMEKTYNKELEAHIKKEQHFVDFRNALNSIKIEWFKETEYELFNDIPNVFIIGNINYYVKNLNHYFTTEELVDEIALKGINLLNKQCLEKRKGVPHILDSKMRYPISDNTYLIGYILQNDFLNNNFLPTDDK